MGEPDPDQKQVGGDGEVESVDRREVFGGENAFGGGAAEFDTELWGEGGDQGLHFGGEVGCQVE